MMVQTVTGQIPVETLGRTLMHEHLFVAYPGAAFDPLATFDRPKFVEKAVRRLSQLRIEYGVNSFVDPCPIELGRDVTMMKEISEKSDMHIVCTTGFFYEDHGLPTYWRARSVDEIADLYIREIMHGIGQTGIRAGAIKVADGGAKHQPAGEKIPQCCLHCSQGDRRSHYYSHHRRQRRAGTASAFCVRGRRCSPLPDRT
ncbi:putative metal-dependent phosphotriesterase family hydrolase [Bradyrhizobium sp. GM0.4]